MPAQTVEAQARTPGRYQLDTSVGRLNPVERAARGKEARARVPRDSHGVFAPPSDRTDPISLLEEQAQTRVPELVPVRWGRMMVSPFTYYRGAALPMASDLATTPVSGLAVQACGDAHLSNFGLFGSAERRLMFAAMTNLDVWYAHADINELRAQADSQLRARQRKMMDKSLAKVRTRDSMQELAKLTRMVDGRPRIISDPPLLVPVDELFPAETDRATFEAQMVGVIAKYRRTLETDRRYLLQQF